MLKIQSIALNLRLSLFIVSLLFFGLLTAKRAVAQVVVYDDMEDGNLTSNPTWSGATANYNVNNTSPVLVGSNSLRSATGASNRVISITNTINLNASNTTWRFLFRNAGGADAANITTIPVGGTASWRFWLAATSTNTASGSGINGYAIIFQSNKLVFVKYTNGNLDGTLMTYTFSGTLPYNSIYSIKMVRTPSNLWKFYVAKGSTGEPVEADKVGETNQNSYFNSGSATVNTILEASDANSSNRYVWDNFKITQAALTVVHSTNSVATSTPIIFPGDAARPFFSFRLTATEDIALKYIHLGANSNVNGALANIKIFRSTDNDYNTTGDNLEITSSFSSSTVGTTYFEFYNNSGVTISDGTSYYYFVIATPAASFSSAPSPLTLTINNTSTWNGAAGGSFVPIANAGFIINSFNNSSASPLTFGAFYDWTGNSSTDLNFAGNWTPGLPGVNDVGRIGVNAGINWVRQPTVASAQTLGGLIIGTKLSNTNLPVTLTVNAALTINGDITQRSNWPATSTPITTINGNASGSISAVDFNVGDGQAPNAGTTGISGVVHNMSGTITLSGELNIVSSLYNSNAYGPGTFNMTGSSKLICAGITTTNAITVGNYHCAFGQGGSTTLTLTGPTAFSVAAGTNYFVLAAGSTQNFTGTNQVIPINLTDASLATAHYQNLNISGAGTETVNTTGTLYVDGNLTNTGTSTLDFTVNNPTITVGGSVTIGSGATIKQGSNPFSVTGGFTNAGTFTGGGGTLTIPSITSTAGAFSTGTGAVTTTGDVSVSGGTFTATGPLTVGNQLLVSNSSSLTFGAGTVNVTGVTQINSGSINFGTGIANFNNAVQFQPCTSTFNSAGTVNFNSALQNSLGSNFSGAGAINVTGAFTNSATFSPGTGTVTFKGGYTNSSIFTYSAGTVVFNNTSSSAAQSVIDNSTNGSLFNNLTFTGTNTTNGPINLSGTGKFSVSSTGLLRLSNTTTKVDAGNGLLTLKSDASGSANVDKIQTGSSLINNINVERYLTGGAATNRGYRLLSSPLAATLNGNIPSLSYINTFSYTTGTGGSTNGFTQTQSGNPTLYFYRENLAPNNSSFISGNYRGVSKINAGANFSIDGDAGTYNLPAGNGFMFFFRGGTSTTSPYNAGSTAQTATLSSLGILNQGNIAVKHWWYTVNAGSGLMYTTTAGNDAVRGFNLIGNPYASSIDWETFGAGITSIGVDNSIYIYNPKLKVYAVYTKGGGGAGSNFNGGAANIIPSGEGFFVRTTGTNPVLTFTENAKVTSQVTGANLLLSVSLPKSIVSYLRLQLFKDSINNEESMVFFKTNAKEQFVINEDAEYLKGNSLLNLSTRSSDNVALAINQMAFPKKGQTIPLNVNVTSAGNYKINLSEIKNIPGMYNIWLRDKYKKDSIDIQHNNSYAFTTSADTSSYGNSRFELILRPDPDKAVRLLSFSGKKDPNVVTLTWVAENEEDHTHYSLERSIDNGKTYQVIDTLLSAKLGTYVNLDQFPSKGLNKYRLKQTDLLGNITYSQIVDIMYTPNTTFSNLANNLINVYPNPVSNTLSLAINPVKETSCSYKITIINSTGLIVQTATTNDVTWQGDVNKLLPGTYFVQVLNTKNNTVIGKSTFIKL